MFKHEEDNKDIISAAKLGSKRGSMKEYLESKKRARIHKRRLKKKRHLHNKKYQRSSKTSQNT
jgi:hypothetical protein